MQKLTGSAAIAFARAHGSLLSKYEDPTEGAREGLSVDVAEQIAAQDPSLIYVDVPEWKVVQAHLERIGVADIGEGGCIAQETDTPTLVEILDESAGGVYDVAQLLPLLAALPDDLADTFEDDALPGGETAARKAYEHFWATIAPAEVKE
ncbi:MAG: hypothetical protein JXB05_37780 [Myxococcaceae bacterium]|nr:hypothetical protein [Myxococcaceae bacterium]